jgi:arylsulfatase A-like enzyme
MIPLADAAVFLLAGAVLLAAAEAFPRVRTPRGVTSWFAFLVGSSWLMVLPRLHGLAVLLLAAGLAVQAGRLLSPRWSLVVAATRRTVTWALLGVVLAAGTLITTRWYAERAALAEHEPAPASGSGPNVLLLVLDTVRAFDLSLHGYERPTTPHLERIGASGMVFLRAMATSPWTLPSHATMFTGRYPHELTADLLTPLDDSHPTIAEALLSHGYRTGGFAANILYGVREYGLGRGFAHYEDYRQSPLWVLQSGSLASRGFQAYQQTFDPYLIPGRKNAVRLNADFLEWLDRDSGRPFFAFLNYYDAHDPYVSEPAFAGKFTGGEPPTRRITTGRHYSPEEITGLRGAYDETIAFLDSEVARLLDSLAARGVLDNTLVILTSDHGEAFGEHGYLGHGNALHTTLVQVPLLLLLEGRIPAGRVEAAVTLRDLPATILDLVGASGHRFPGTSLARFWRPNHATGEAVSPVLAELPFEANLPDRYPVSRGDMRSIVVGRSHYIRNGDGMEELYDLAADPHELRNLAQTSEGRQRVVELQVELERAAEPGAGDPLRSNVDGR